MCTEESDEVREMYCEPCHKDGFKNGKADGFCITCVEYLCATCLRYHRKHLPDHDLQDQYDMPQDFCLEPCPSHSGEIVKFYCKTCSDFACPHCKSGLHTNCTDVLHLPKLSADIEKSAELKSLGKKIKKAKEELGRLRGMIKKSEKHAEMLRADVIKAMKKQRDVMNSQFDNLEEHINNMILKIHNDDSAKLQNQSNKADIVEKELTSLQADIQNMKRALQRCKLYIKSKIADKVVDSAGKRLKEIQEKIVVHDYSYEPVEYSDPERLLGSLRMEDTLKSTGLKERSYISTLCLETKMTEQWIRKMRKSQKMLLMVFMVLLALLDFKVGLPLLFAIEVLLCYTERTKMIVFSAFMKTVNWILQKSTQNNWQVYGLLNCIIQTIRYLCCEDIKVKTAGNVRCNVTGLCLLSSDNIAAVDNNNFSVKIIDLVKQSVISELSLGEEMKNKPWDVTKVGESKLAVTLPFSETVCFLLFKPSKGSDSALSCYRKMSVSGECRGIVCIGDKLIISFQNELRSVKIFDLDGNPLKSYSKDVTGRNIFSHPYYIATSPDHNTIYVSDYGSNQVISLSADGKVLAVYKHSELTNLFGITVDKAGKVYVCGLNTIYKLSADLSDGQKLLGVKNRVLNKAVYCHLRQSLYIASWNQNSIGILVLK